MADLEAIREALNLDRRTVLGPSCEADLERASARTRPDRMARPVNWAGTGIQNDRGWKAAHEADRAAEPHCEVAVKAVRRAPLDDWRAF